MNERNNFTKYSLFLGFLGWSPSMLNIYIYTMYTQVGWVKQMTGCCFRCRNSGINGLMLYISWEGMRGLVLVESFHEAFV